jgi:hypothetical protein
MTEQNNNVALTVIDASLIAKGENPYDERKET